MLILMILMMMVYHLDHFDHLVTILMMMLMMNCDLQNIGFPDLTKHRHGSYLKKTSHPL
jgi:hypothetical protein